LEENSIAPQLGVSQSDSVQQYEEEQQGEEALNAHHVDRDNQTNQVRAASSLRVIHCHIKLLCTSSCAAEWVYVCMYAHEGC